MDTSHEELTTCSGDGRKRKLSPETAESSDLPIVPQLKITPSDPVPVSSPASTVETIKRTRRTQELPSRPPTISSDPNGDRSCQLSLGIHESTWRNDTLHASPPVPRRGLLFPPNIEYELQVQCNGSITSSSQGYLDLNDADGYPSIETKAIELVRESCEEPLDADYLHFREGHCIEIIDNEKKSQFAIANPMQWKNMCHKLVKDFGDRRLKDCTLLISRAYSLFELRPTDSENEDKDPREDAFVNNKAYELRSLMKMNIDGKAYLPKIDLDGFASQPMIRAVINHSDRLKDLDKVWKEEIGDIIDLRARKLFTACILNSFGMYCFNKLLRGGYHDDNLPKRRQEERYACCKNHNDQHNGLAEKIGAFSAFIFERQGHFFLEPNDVVPILPVAVDKSQRSSDLSTNPTSFTTAVHEEQNNSTAAKDDEKFQSRLGEGAHGTVYLVRIDPAHNQITSNPDELFALKEFRNSRSDREQTMLSRIESYDGPYLTKRLVSWTQGNDTWMLFPLAECNLADYMDRLVFRDMEINTFWLLEQFIGLADALSFIHTLPSDVLPNEGNQHLRTTKRKRKSSGIGWHHDVKPQNILYFIDAETKKGSFQLCDYGSSKVDALRSHSLATSSRRGTKTYEPPETLEGSLSRPYDVWALGCVFLIIVTWALLGSAGVEKFCDDRMGKRFQDSNNMDDAFWEKLPGEGPSLRKAVRDHIELLKRTAKDPRHQLFSLALDVIEEMLYVDKDKRIKMEKVRQQLQSEVARAKNIWEQNNAASTTDNTASDAHY